MSEQEATDQRQAEACDPATSAQRLEMLAADGDLRILVAGNPGTPAHLLELLAKDEDEQIREQVANNPNTPWKILEQLAWEFPHAFLHNPLGPLYLLAHPEQIRTDERFWRSLLREASVPSWWWSWLLNHPALSVCPTVRLHIQYAGETMHPSGVREQGEEHLLLALVDLLRFACTSLAGKLVGNQTATTCEHIVKEQLRWLAHCDDPQVRWEVASNVHTPVEVLRDLARDADEKVRARVASNKQTPPEVLRDLAREANGWVRTSVALHEHTPVEVLQTLARDADGWVRRYVPQRVQTPVEVLRDLARDAEAEVRREVASNAHTPVEVLRDLARDANESVRERVVRNQHTPVEALQTLARAAIGRCGRLWRSMSTYLWRPCKPWLKMQIKRCGVWRPSL